MRTLLKIPTAAVAITTIYALVFLALGGCDSPFGDLAKGLASKIVPPDSLPIFSLIESELSKRERPGRVCEANHLLAVTLVGALAAICVYVLQFKSIVCRYRDYLIQRVRDADKTVPSSAFAGLGAALFCIGLDLACIHMYLNDGRLLFFRGSLSRTYDSAASIVIVNAIAAWTTLAALFMGLTALCAFCLPDVGRALEDRRRRVN